MVEKRSRESLKSRGPPMLLSSSHMMRKRKSEAQKSMLLGYDLPPQKEGKLHQM